MIGYIFRLEENKVVVMTKELDFYKIKRTNTMVCLGQEVAFSKNDITKPSFFSKTNIIKFGAISSSIAAAIIIIFFTFVNPNIISNNNVYAFIDVDTNLSVRLKINDHNKVLGIDPIDKHSESAIKDVNFKNKTLSDALEIIVDKSKASGLNLNEPSEYIMISASINSDASVSKKEISKKLDEIVNSVNTKIEDMDDLKLAKRIIKVDLSTCELASANNVSMGRYVAYVKTKENGLDITIEEARENSLSVLLEKADYTTLDQSQNNSKIIAANDNVDTDKKINDKSLDENKVEPTNSEDKKVLNNNLTDDKSDNDAQSSKISDTKQSPSKGLPSKNSSSKRTNEQENSNKTHNNRVFELSTPMPKKVDTIVDNQNTSKNHTNMSDIYSTPQAYATPIALSTKNNDASPTPIPYIAYYPDFKHHTPQPKITTPSNTAAPSIETHYYKGYNTPLPKNDYEQPNIEIVAFNAQSITSDSAIISGEVKSFFNSNMPTSILLIYWQTRSPGYIYTAATRMQNSFPASISAEIKNLHPNTDYQYQVVVNNFFRSNISFFKTQPLQTNATLPKPTSNHYYPTPPKQEPINTAPPKPKYEYPPYYNYYNYPQPTSNKKPDYKQPGYDQYYPHKP